MGKVARQVVEQAGINVDELVAKLVRAAAAEFTTYYYYTILRVNSIGFDGEGLKEIIEDARIEDRNHFEALTPRIYELGGALPRDIREFAKDAACPDAYLPKDPQDTKAMLNVLVEAERCAIRVYTDICNMTSARTTAPTSSPWPSCTRRWSTRPGSPSTWAKDPRAISAGAHPVSPLTPRVS